MPHNNRGCGKILSTSITRGKSRCVPPRKALTLQSKRFSGAERLVRSVLLLTAVLLVPAVAQYGSRAYSVPHFKPNRSAIVQLFEWKFEDVARECEEFLGPMGYGGVQLSPVTEHLVYQSDSLQSPRWERYHPISYIIASRSGNEEDFSAMSRTCNAAGVRVYVDVVLNHMAGVIDDSSNQKDENGDEPLKGSADSTANLTALYYPAVPYDSKDFHQPCQVEDYNDGHEVRNCQFDGRPDLDHSRSSVRERIVALLNKLVDLGAAGFYVDSAKYIWPMDLKTIFDAVKNLNSVDFDFPEEARPFFYQNVVDLGTEAISKTEYSGHGVVTEYLYPAELAIIFNRKAPLSALINWGPAMGFLPHHESLVFVDTPEGQRETLLQLGQNHLLTHRWRSRYIMANAFMLMHPYGGLKRIMSSYRFAADTRDAGPPTLAGDDGSAAATRSPEFDDEGQCTVDSGWVCEHRWAAIANMVEVANSLDVLQDGLNNFQTHGPHHISFCRGNKAFIAINNDAKSDYETEVFACLQAGTYCDVISGGRTAGGDACKGREIVVDEEGKAKLSLPAVEYSQSEEEDEHNEQVTDFGVLAIYEGSKISGEDETLVENRERNGAEDGGEVVTADEDEAAADVKSEYELITEAVETKADEGEEGGDEAASAKDEDDATSGNSEGDA